MQDFSVISWMERIKNSASVVDLSYTLEEGMPAWPTHARYGTTVYESYESGADALHSMVTLSEHSGTHIDAPLHFIPGGCSVDQLPVTTVMGRGVAVQADFIEPCGLFTLSHLKAFEAENSEILSGDVVMFHFGWEEKYQVQPNSHDFLNDWPGLSGEAAEYLMHKQVAAVGCDTLALDAFGAPNAAHQVLLGNGIPIIENICHLTEIPVFTYVIGLPMKLKNGSGSPIRLIAFRDKENL